VLALTRVHYIAVHTVPIIRYLVTTPTIFGPGADSFTMSLLLHEPLGYPTTATRGGSYGYRGYDGWDRIGHGRRPWFRRQRSGREPRNKETVAIITTLLLIEHRTRSGAVGNATPPLPVELWEVILGQLVSKSVAMLAEVRTLRPGEPQVRVPDIWDDDGLLAPAECFPLAYWRMENAVYAEDWVCPECEDENWASKTSCVECGEPRPLIGGCAVPPEDNFDDRSTLLGGRDATAAAPFTPVVLSNDDFDDRISPLEGCGAAAAAPFTPVEHLLDELEEEWQCKQCYEQHCSRKRCHMCGRSKPAPERWDVGHAYSSEDDGFRDDASYDFDFDDDHGEPTGYHKGTPIYWY
jgi:hypothetical protein